MHYLINVNGMARSRASERDEGKRETSNFVVLLLIIYSYLFIVSLENRCVRASRNPSERPSEYRREQRKGGNSNSRANCSTLSAARIITTYDDMAGRGVFIVRVKRDVHAAIRQCERMEAQRPVEKRREGTMREAGTGVAQKYREIPRHYLARYTQGAKIFLSQPHVHRPVISSLRGILREVSRSDSTFSYGSLPYGVLQLPTFYVPIYPLFLPSSLRFPQIRRCSGRNSSTLPAVANRLLVPTRWSEYFPSSVVGRGRGFAFLGLYRKRAHVSCIKPSGRSVARSLAGLAEGRKWSAVWFRVRRVQRFPSLRATHEIPKVQAGRQAVFQARRDALPTARRNASYFYRFFFFFPFRHRYLRRELRR